MPWPKLPELKYEWPALADETPEEHRYSCRANGHTIKDVGVVERVLQRHEGVEEVGVCSRPLAGAKVLFAHVKMKPGIAMNEQTIIDLRGLAENYLPAWMRPMRYKEIKVFPRVKTAPDQIDRRRLGNWKIKTLNKESRGTPVDRRKRDFSEIRDIELMDPVNTVHFEGGLVRIRTLKLWNSDSIFFDASYLCGGRRTTATFWTDRKAAIEMLEVMPRGAHIVVEGKLKTILTGGPKMSINVIEVLSLQEVSLWASARMDDLTEVLEAIF